MSNTVDITFKSWWGKLWAKIAYRAKAFTAGIAALVASELLVLITDASFQDQVKNLVPPAYAFLIPVAFALVVGVLTHGVTNGPKPQIASTDEETSAG